MTAQPHYSGNQNPASSFEILRLGREVLLKEAEAVKHMADSLGDSFLSAVDRILHCQGSLIVTGMGKAGLVGQKLVATFASTGTPSHFLHPGEAVHGDLGRVQKSDLVLALSYSGRTTEVTQLLPTLRSRGIPVIAMTSTTTNDLSRGADVTLELGKLQEACNLGLAPSTSTTSMIALGDALALVVSQLKGFRAEDFARFHPAGSLGRKLARVDDVMRPLEDCRLADRNMTVREVLVKVSRPGRRTGAIMLIDGNQRLDGIFTDSDLAKNLEQNRDSILDRPIQEVMTRLPATLLAGDMLSRAIQIMAERRVSELPVVDDDGKPVGLIDITDLMDFMPQESVAAEEAVEEPPVSTIPFKVQGENDH